MAIYPFVKTGINLEDNMFREISQTQEKKKNLNGSTYIRNLK